MLDKSDYWKLSNNLHGIAGCDSRFTRRQLAEAHWFSARPMAEPKIGRTPSPERTLAMIPNPPHASPNADQVLLERKMDHDFVRSPARFNRQLSIIDGIITVCLLATDMAPIMGTEMTAVRPRLATERIARSPLNSCYISKISNSVHL